MIKTLQDLSQMLQFTIMTKSTRINLLNRSIIRTSPPHSLDHLSDTNVIGLEFIQPNTDNQRGEKE